MNQPAHGAGFTARWNVTYDDYRRGIAMQAHYTNRFPEGVDAVLIDAADNGRVHQLFIALLDLGEAMMPTLGDPETATKLSELAATWAAKHTEGENQ
jgi:hypothetical protein